MEKEYDVFACGNALVDLIIESTDECLKELNMVKGGVIFLDEKKAKETITSIMREDPAALPGGAAANVISMMSHLGSKAYYCGKVGNDLLGTQFEEILKKDGVTVKIEKIDTHTGTALTIITPDAQRSFAVYLGASVKITNEDIDFDAISKSKIVHIEGYQFFDKNLRAMVVEIAKSAKENKCLISFDLSSYGLVKEHKSELEKFVIEYVDILFANEDESLAYTGLNPDESVEELSKTVTIAIVKIGEKGSLIKTKGEFYEIAPVKTNAIDTNGAGDAYAGAFLYAYVNDKSISECGNLASFAASRVVSEIGARLKGSIKKESVKILN